MKRLAPSQAVTLSIGDRSVREGDSTSRISIPVVLSAASPSTVTVRFATSDGTATKGSDYRARTGTVCPSPRAARATLVVTLLSDRLAEPDETFTVGLSGPTAATIADGQAVVRIRNDD